MQEKNKIVTVSILVLCALVLVFTFSNLKFNNNLNANDGSNNNKPKDNPFTYQNPRSSNENGVVFENNFGGSNDEQICQVYNLDYYYIIGNTKSNDYYFFNNSNSNVFVIKMSRSGNVVNVAITNDNLEYVDSYVTSFGIYILSKNLSNNSTSVSYYSFSTSTLQKIYVAENLIPLKVIKTNKVVIAGTKNNKLHLHFYFEDSNEYEIYETNILTTELQLFVFYQNGYLAFINHNNAFTIYFIDNKNYSPFYNAPGYNLHSFTINEYGFCLLLESVTQICFVSLKFNFEEQNKTYLANSGYNYTLLMHNNNIYIFYKTLKDKINLILFSSKGDLVFNIELNILARALLYGKNMQDNFILLLKSNENNLHIVNINSLFQIVKENYLSFNATGTVLEVEENFDANLMIFGNIEGNNTVIKHNFGKQDIFVIKYSN